MAKRKGPLSWLKDEWMKHRESGGNKRTTYQYVLIVILFGATMMVISNFFTKGATEKTDKLPVSQSKEITEEITTFGQKGFDKDDIISAYEQTYEQRIKDALEKIIGVDDVTVVVNVDATDRKILEKNTITQSLMTNETDREGGKRQVEDQSKDEQVVIIRNGDKEVPIVLQTKKPEIRGVLVVAKGAENINVKKWIIESVTRVLDVPSHRVAVMPKKTKGD